MAASSAIGRPVRASTSSPTACTWLPLVDRLMPHPATRRLATRLPDRLQPAAQRYGLVAHLDANGQITQTLHAPSGGYREIVGVRQNDNWLYLGSLHETAVGRVPIPA